MYDFSSLSLFPVAPSKREKLFFFFGKKILRKKETKGFSVRREDIQLAGAIFENKARRVVPLDSENYSKRGLYMQTFLSVALCARCFADCHLREKIYAQHIRRDFIDALFFSPFCPYLPRVIERKEEP